MPYVRRRSGYRRRRSSRRKTAKDAWGYTRLRRPRRQRRNTKYRAKLGRAIGMQSIPFPMKTFTTLTYTDNRLLTQAAAGVVANYQYCINDIYDPNYTGAGGQPKYFDTLLGATGGAAPYRSFRVHASKIKVTFYSYSATTQGDVQCFIGVQPTTTTSLVPQDMEDILTSPYISHRAQGQLTNSKPMTMTKYQKVKKMYGVTYLDDDKYVGSNSASPSTRALWNVGFLSVDSAAQGYMNIVVQIKYFVELTAMNLVADS